MKRKKGELTKKQTRKWMEIYRVLWIKDHNKLVEINEILKENKWTKK